jgi:hypothetical protein
MNKKQEEELKLIKAGKIMGGLRIRDLVIEECCEELTPYAFTSTAFLILRRLKEKRN